MTRSETIGKYIDAFLKGKTPQAKEKFMAKPEHLQYASIMQWRSRMRKLENTPKSILDITELIKKLNTMIANATDMSQENVQAINLELDTLRTTLAESCERARLRSIKELESQQEQISARLAQLRNGQ